MQVERDRYSIFFCLGNEKAPQVSAAGHVSVFMNQFPFGGLRNRGVKEGY